MKEIEEEIERLKRLIDVLEKELEELEEDDIDEFLEEMKQFLRDDEITKDTGFVAIDPEGLFVLDKNRMPSKNLEEALVFRLADLQDFNNVCSDKDMQFCMVKVNKILTNES